MGDDSMKTANTNLLRLLHLLHLSSPALPVGAYAYSQGLEYAIDSTWLKSDDDIREWIGDALRCGITHLDLPLLCRCYRSWHSGDLEALLYWNEYLLASRETRELSLEDRQLGEALRRLLQTLEAWPSELNVLESVSFALCFAVAGLHWQIPLSELLRGFAFSWLENQVAAATKAVPLGQSQAQKLLLALMPDLDSSCNLALELNDADIGMSLPGLALASALHERQYSRLFRS